MPINYSVFPMKNPQKREEAPKYYGKVQANGTADFEVLADGKIVKLDGFGSFQFQLSDKGAATEKEYTTFPYQETIKGNYFHFITIGILIHYQQLGVPFLFPQN